MIYTPTDSDSKSCLTPDAGGLLRIVVTRAFSTYVGWHVDHSSNANNQGSNWLEAGEHLLRLLLIVKSSHGNRDYHPSHYYGSEFSQGVWISFFIFYSLALSLRKLTGIYCVLIIYAYMILLRNIKSRSNWKMVAGVISQWFWWIYFAHNFILYAESSKKNYKLPIQISNTAE